MPFRCRCVSDTAIYVEGEQHVLSVFDTLLNRGSFRNDNHVGTSTGDHSDQYLVTVGYRALVTVSCELIKNRESNLRTREVRGSDGERETETERERKKEMETERESKREKERQRAASVNRVKS